MSEKPPQPPIEVEPPRLGELLAGASRFLAGLGGERGGPNGQRLFWYKWIGVAVVTLLIDLLDVQSRLAQAGANNLILPIWRACTDEFSSGAMVILLVPALQRMAIACPPWDGRIGRFLGLHAAGAAVFSIIHVGGFIVLRLVVYGLCGELYRFGGAGEFFYELPRDVVTYGLIMGGFWGATIFLQQGGAAPAPARPTFDIRDNARIIRTPIDDILAVRSAGNYVEFLLADGRTPLMRATLAQMAEQLSSHGLIRTHRSWLVNRARIAQVDPAGSGDFRITLAGGVQAPLSRRFRGSVAL